MSAKCEQCCMTFTHCMVTDDGAILCFACEEKTRLKQYCAELEAKLADAERRVKDAERLVGEWKRNCRRGLQDVLDDSDLRLRVAECLEAETVAAIVAWLRSDASRTEKLGGMIGQLGSSHGMDAADAIESGRWKRGEGGGE